MESKLTSRRRRLKIHKIISSYMFSKFAEDSPEFIKNVVVETKVLNSMGLVEHFSSFSRIKNTTDVSEQCKADVAVFEKSLLTFFETLVECRVNDGCTDEQKKILDENMYAVKQIDAFGKLPAGILEMTLISSGSYTECRDLIAPYNVQYCYADAVFDNQTNTAIGMNMGVKIAVCMPRSCSEEVGHLPSIDGIQADRSYDIPKVINSLDIEGIPLNFVHSNCVPTSVKPTTAFWIFMSFMAVFVVWAIVATIVDFVLSVYYPKKSRESTAMRILLSYSVYTNGAAILETGPDKPGTLKSLASIRFISMTWVVAGHTLGQNAFSDSVLPVLSLWNPFLSTTITNAFFSVDTFFLLSGILVSYIFFKSKPSARFVKNPFTWVMFYVHRYLRLTPPIMIFIGFYTVILPFTNGPWTASVEGIVGSLEDSIEACQKYWWRNLLYINNLFGNSPECYPVAWYLAVDTQLYVVAPVFLITLALWPILGVALLVLCGAASVAYVYAITFRDDLPATVVGAFAFQKTSDFFSEYYEKPWTRCTPYLIGLGVGYLLTMGRKPKLHWSVISSSWAIAAAVALASLYGPHRYIKGDDNWSEFIRSTYNNFSRIGWALAVSWYIYRVIPVVVLSYIFAFIWSCLFEVPVVKLEKMLIESISPAKKEVKPNHNINNNPHERIYAYDKQQKEPYQIRF
ncbi:acyltransferase [Ancylostoma ceylanicum]|uniref:Acyltransferase n=1 Tax=Ancylostoma ceylanicum TaxID=53326 RepID=A0A0D6LXS0_9BILA|nr:acyltransferase [Ancylostoma ceylanicum]